VETVLVNVTDAIIIKEPVAAIMLPNHLLQHLVVSIPFAPPAMVLAADSSATDVLDVLVTSPDLI
jgi:hypothetical protein